MTIILYDLCAGDSRRRVSPHCWKARMALAHKGLTFETRATPFTKIREIGGGFSPTVPVIDDGGRLVRDSFDIALYLEETCPDRRRRDDGRLATLLRSAYSLLPGEVEAVGVHHFHPGRHEILDELLLRIRTGIDLR